MPRPLRKRILTTNLLLSVVLTLSIGVTTMVFFSRTLLQTTEVGIDDTITQSARNAEFSIAAIANSSTQLSHDPDFLVAIDSSTFNPQVPPILNTLRNTSFGIYAVTLYTTAGQTYSTFNISGLVDLDDYRNSDHFASFFNTDAATQFSIRTDLIADSYDYFAYDESYGMLTYAVKLRDENNDLKGYLFVDIKPEYLYSRFFQYENHETMSGTTTYILDDNNQYLRSYRNDPTLYDALSKDGVPSSNLRYLVLHHELYDGYDIVTIVPRAYVIGEIRNAALYILLAVIIINGLAVGTSLVLNRSIQKPLLRLKNKVKSERMLD